MRIVFIGGGKISVETAKALIEKDHEVIIIENDKAKIDEISQDLDCSFLQGDGSQPKILSEVNPVHTDFLFCFTNSDQVNVIASLVGRSLGFKRVITSIGDSQFEGICHELGLKDTIIPSRTIGRYLEDMVAGGENVELSTVLQDEARFFTLIAKEDEAVSAQDLGLPSDAKVICFYRDGKFFLAGEDTTFRIGDEIVILTHSKNMPALQERWLPKPLPEGVADSASNKNEELIEDSSAEPNEPNF